MAPTTRNTKPAASTETKPEETPADAPETVAPAAAPDAAPAEPTKPTTDAVEPEDFPDPSEVVPETLTADPKDGHLAVILKVQISGTRDGKDWPAPGTLVVLPEQEALGLVRGGSAALPVRPGTEKAVDTAPVEYAAELAKESIKAD